MAEGEPTEQRPMKEDYQRIDISELLNDFEMSWNVAPIIKLARIRPNLIGMIIEEAQKRIDIIDAAAEQKGRYSEAEIHESFRLDDLQNKLSALLKNND
ncbi:MAG: hypothetical protein WC227_03820 [Patescibacteria group bacterium]|jgi:hypothetical protein